MSQFSTTKEVIDNTRGPLVPILLSAVILFFLFRLVRWGVLYMFQSIPKSKKKSKKKKKKRKKKYEDSSDDSSDDDDSSE